jgi:hypothetical protein
VSISYFKHSVSPSAVSMLELSLSSIQTLVSSHRYLGGASGNTCYGQMQKGHPSPYL